MIHLCTTCPDLDSARDIASAALQARLAACANITEGVLSLFYWQDAIEEEPEVHLLLKTRAAHVAALAQLVAEEHPYDLPVITWEEVGTTPEATAWLERETGG